MGNNIHGVTVITEHYSYFANGDCMVKTTIDIDDERWKRFSIKVIEDFGGRKKNDVIEGLLEGFLKDPRLSEALENWMKETQKQSKKK